MALSFPSSPTVGDIYTVGSKSWRWDGGIWSSHLTDGTDGRWTLVLDDPGTSLTNWTSVDGTWALDTYIENTDTSGWSYMEWNGSFSSTTVMIQAEFYVPTPGTANYPGGYICLARSSETGFSKIRYRPVVANYNNHTTGAGTWAMFISGSNDTVNRHIELNNGIGAYDTWTTMSIVSDGGSFYGYIDGNYIGNVGTADTRPWDTFAIACYGTEIKYRNIKAWQAVSDLPSSGEVLTPDDFYGLAQTVEEVSGTTYSAVIGDIGKLKNATNGSAVTITLDTPTSMGATAGARIDFRQGGAGQVTFVAGSGATVNATPGLKTRDQYSGATAIAMSTTEWWLIGDLAV